MQYFVSFDDIDLGTGSFAEEDLKLAEP